MHVTKSILCLWTGCSAFACFTAYAIAYDRASDSIITMENLDLGGGQSFAIGFPATFSEAIAAAGVVMAGVGLLVSCCLNRQAVVSRAHAVALLFLVPLAVALLIP
jgi:hypothetical protein